jgi:hypothetical protein
MEPMQKIAVLIDEVDGWHRATSPEMPGLYVAHPELSVVLTDLAPTICALHLADTGEEFRGTVSVVIEIGHAK